MAIFPRNNDYEVIRSRRKTLGIEITTDLKVRIRAPYYVSDTEIMRFVIRNTDWIEKHLEKMAKKAREAEEHRREIEFLSATEIRELAGQAMTDIPQRLQKYAPLVGVNYGRVTIRNQRSRWGSCSSRGNLNFNCLLMLTPEAVRDYVVVHELCHRKQMNHSPKFWAEVERVLPEYREQKAWLRKHGQSLIERLPS